MPQRRAEGGAASNSLPGQVARPAHSPRGGRPSLVRWRIDVPDPRLCCSPGLSRRTMSCRCGQQSRRLSARTGQLGLRFTATRRQTLACSVAYRRAGPLPLLLSRALPLDHVVPQRPAERGAASDSLPGQVARPAHSPRGGRPSLVRWLIDVPDPRLCCFPELCRWTHVVPQRPAERGAASDSLPGQVARPAHSPRGGRPSLVRWRIGVPDPCLCCFPELCRWTMSCRSAQQSERRLRFSAQDR